MMKKAEIFARVINKWPEGVDLLDNFACGEIIAASPRNPSRVYGHMGDYSHDDFGATVSRAQWEAERARIAMEELTELDQKLGLMGDEARIADLAAIACGKRSKEDQGIWDNVAIAAFNGLCSQKRQVTYSDVSGVFDLAEAFMAERAKRMNG